MPNWNALREEQRRWGYLRVLYRIMMDRLAPWIFLVNVNVRELTQATPPQEDDKPSSREATYDELIAATHDIPGEMSKQFVDNALDRGDICVAAFDQGKIVSFVWRSYNVAPHTEKIWVEFKPPYRYGYKAYTLPAYRGKHIRDSSETDYICRARGRTHAIGFIETHNYPSIKRNIRNGNVKVGMAGYIKLFGKTFFFHSKGAKEHGFRFYERIPEQSDT